MNKISELVDLRNRIQDQDWSSVVNAMSDSIEKFKVEMNAAESSTGIPKSEFDSSVTNVLSQLNTSTTAVDEYISSINRLIRQHDDSLRANSIELDKASNSDSAETILKKIKDRESTHHEKTVDFFSERCKIYSNWKYPGLQLRPGYGTWTRNLVDLDPLYLVDTRSQLLEPVKKEFNDHYRSRLRFKTISDVDKPIFGNLPKGQFGLIVATEFFNQKALGTIERYLTEMIHLLKAGGALIFTFNDCDIATGVRNSENNYDCYTPGREVEEIAKKLGFKVAQTVNVGGTISWMELIRPGNLTSIRGGQTLARIKKKNV